MFLMTEIVILAKGPYGEGDHFGCSEATNIRLHTKNIEVKSPEWHLNIQAIQLHYNFRESTWTVQAIYLTWTIQVSYLNYSGCTWTIQVNVPELIRLNSGSSSNLCINCSGYTFFLPFLSCYSRYLFHYFTNIITSWHWIAYYYVLMCREETAHSLTQATL